MPTVLVVEDDPDIRDLIVAVLTDRGFEVRAAADQRDAQRVLDREASRIALLVADVHLSSSATGFDVARRARRLNPRMEVIYVTGRGLDAGKFGAAGGVFLPKPFNIEDLGDMAEALTRDLA
jgi:DNA-binding response OmpR family regulator